VRERRSIFTLTLRAVLEQARKWELVYRNVATLVGPPRVARQQDTGVRAGTGPPFPQRNEGRGWKALYSVAIALGLRQGEALGLRWSDIDFETERFTVMSAPQRVEGKLQLVETKRDRTRLSVGLPIACRHALLAHRATQEEERRWAGTRWKETGFVFTSGADGCDIGATEAGGSLGATAKGKTDVSVEFMVGPAGFEPATNGL
jgi:integrase